MARSTADTQRLIAEADRLDALLDTLVPSSDAERALAARLVKAVEELRQRAMHDAAEAARLRAENARARAQLREPTAPVVLRLVRPREPRRSATPRASRAGPGDDEPPLAAALVAVGSAPLSALVAAIRAMPDNPERLLAIEALPERAWAQLWRAVRRER